LAEEREVAVADNRARPRHLVWPIILIGLGILLLLQNLGFLSWSLWDILWRFWPMILVLIGLELLLGRRNPGLAAVVAVAVLVLAVAGSALAARGSASPLPSSMSSFLGTGGAGRAQHLTEKLGSYERATVDIQFGAGDLTVRSLPSQSGSLMEGDFSHQGDRGVSRSFQCRDGDCTLRLLSRGERNWFFNTSGADDWNVHLTPRIPLDLRVKSGASRIDLDLSALQISTLRLDIGASSGTVRLPAAGGATTATVKAGAADLEIAVPLETSARIRARGGLSSYQIDEQRFPRDGDYYVSPDFAQAINRVDLEIDAGVASVEIR
jgi:hypothetical protein